MIINKTVILFLLISVFILNSLKVSSQIKEIDKNLPEDSIEFLLYFYTIENNIKEYAVKKKGILSYDSTKTLYLTAYYRTPDGIKEVDSIKWTISIFLTGFFRTSCGEKKDQIKNILRELLTGEKFLVNVEYIKMDNGKEYYNPKIRDSYYIVLALKSKRGNNVRRFKTLRDAWKAHVDSHGEDTLFLELKYVVYKMIII